MADIDNLTIEISANANAAINALESLASALDAVNAQLDRIDPSRLKSFSKAAEEVTRATSDFSKISEDISNLTSGLDKVGQESGNMAQVQDVADNISKSINNITRNANEAARSLETIGTGASSGGGGFRNLLKGIGSVGIALGTVSDKFNLFGKTMRLTFGLITAPIQLATKAIRGLGRANDTTAKTAKRLAKELTRVSKMLKLMVTRMALRAVIKEVGNGFKSLALHSEEFNSSVSGIMNASKQLGYSFSAMVSPLINALAPALIYVINLFTKLANIIQQVFASLSGASSWNKAKEFTDDWGQSIKDANKNAKELKKTVLGFDELNQLQEKYTSGGDTSGNIEDMFETMPIEKKWKDVADYIKNIASKLFEPIKNAWDKVGEQVVSAWKRALENVKKLGSDVARDFWKVWEQPATQKIFENILKIIRDIGDFVANITKQLDEAWNKNEVGLHILENIRDIIGIIVAGIQRITESWADWAKTIDFYPLLSAVNEFLDSLKKPAEAIMGIFEDLNKNFIQPVATWLVEEGVPKIIGVFTDFNNKVEWDTIRDRLDRVWKALEPFAKTVGEGLILFMQDVSDTLANFFNSKVWDDFIDTLIKWMKKVDAEDVAKGIKLVAGAIITLKGALFVLEGIKYLSTFVTAFGSFLALFKAGGDGAKAAGTIKSLADSIEIFGNALTGLGATAHIFDSFRHAIDTKEINNLSKDLQEGTISVDEYNRACDEIQYGKIVESGYSWKQFWKDFFNPFSENNSVGSLIKMLTTDTTTYRNELILLNNAYSQGTITQSEYSQKLEDLKQKYGMTGDTVKSSSKDIETSLGGIEKSADKTGKSVKDLQDGISKTSSDAPTEIHKMGFSINTDLDGIKTTADKVRSAFDRKQWTFDGVADGLEKTFKDAKDAIKGVWNGIADKLNGDFDIGGSTLHINLPKFANGGMPEDGLFMANHGELVGKFSNGKTAVANNKQIVEGISSGVYNAVTAALASSNSGSGDVPVCTTIYIGEEQIARAVTNGQRKIDRRYSPVMA